MEKKKRTNSILEGARLLRAGHLVAFPTETVYGLGADATQSQAVKQIYVTKGRPSSNPLIVHLADTADVPEVVEIQNGSRVSALFRRLSPLWPGPLTIVFPQKKALISDQVT
ncbi:Sua5/YciO/YrdC/YwlC family protein, partial [bacterium]|nr:Sua5/YciO/YrdC/YwlC family protein [bacterium]